MAISQNAILAKRQSPKCLPVLDFLINLPETFKYEFNLANKLVRGFLIQASKIQKKRIFFWILGSKVLKS